jgi:ectoine hydroxylase-related dioxygenase (phytanoyl-CoA dioxygenase family)
MTEQERYLFDLQGFLVVPGALDAQDLQALNALLDARLTERDAAEPGRNTHRFVGLLGWGAPMRALIANPRIAPYLSELLGPQFRLDHDYADVIRQGLGPIGATLHGGGEAAGDLTAWYRYHNGAMRNGLTVVAYNLRDVSPGDGGFACVPGSHKANLPLPAEWRDLQTPHPVVLPVTGPAGTAILFTEALTHGTLPWRAQTERRTLFFKYSPHPLAWAVPHYDPGQFDDLTEAQRAILEGPNARYRGRPAAAR